MKPMSAIWWPRLRAATRSSTTKRSGTTPPMASAKPFPTPLSAARRPAGAGGNFQREFIEHCINGTNYATGKKGIAIGSDRLPCQRCTGQFPSGWPRADGNRQPTHDHY